MIKPGGRSLEMLFGQFHTFNTIFIAKRRGFSSGIPTPLPRWYFAPIVFFWFFPKRPLNAVGGFAASQTNRRHPNPGLQLLHFRQGIPAGAGEPLFFEFLSHFEPGEKFTNF